MEHTLIQLFLTLNKINQRLKEISADLDQLTSDFIAEDFEEIIAAEQLSIIDNEDYE